VNQIPSLRSNLIRQSIIHVLVFLFTMVFFILFGANAVRDEISNRQEQAIENLAQQGEIYLSETEHLMHAAALPILNLPSDSQAALLMQVREHFPRFTAIFLLDETGRVVLEDTDAQSMLSLDMSGQPYFRHGKDASHGYFSDPFVSLTNNLVSVTVALPIYDGSQFQGMLVGEMNLTLLQEAIDGVYAGDESISFIVDHQGTLVAHPNQQWVQERRNFGDIPIIQSGIQGAALSGKYYDDHQDATLIASVIPMSNNWIVVTTQPAQIANRPINGMVIFSAVAFGITLIISLWVQLRNVRGIIEPISALKHRAANLVTSPYQPISVEAMGHFQEIYSLNQSFEHMAAEIHERDRYLEEQVMVRTVEIKEQAKELELAYEFLQQHTWDLSLINDVNAALLRGDQLDEVIHLFAEKTREAYATTSSAGAAVFLLSEDGQYLIMKNIPVSQDRYEKIEKLFGRDLPELRIPLANRNLHQQIMENRIPRIFNQAEEINQWFSEFINETWIKQPWLLKQAQKLAPQVSKVIGLKSLAVIPLFIGEEPIGLMEISNEEPFTSVDLRRHALIANQLAVAIQRGRDNEEFRALKDFNESIVQTVPGAIVVTDLEGKFSFVNPATVDLLGYQPDELVGEHWQMIFPTDQYEIVKSVDDRPAQGTADTYEVELLHKDGERIPALIKGSQRYDSQTGEYTGTLAVLTEISDRKHAEEVILQEKNFSDEIINSLPGIFYLFNAEGKFLRWNQNFEDITGNTAEEMLQVHPNDVIFEADQAISEEALITGFTEGRVVVEARLKTVAGPVPYYFVGRRTFIDDAPHLMGNAIDISERVYAENILRQRSLELERSNQDLERFAYISSHDLQEPLRKIQAFGDRLRTKYEDKLDERGLDYLLRMQEAARRAQEMVEDLLVYSRVSTRGGDFEPVNLNQITQNIVANLQPSIELSDALVTVGTLPTIHADPTQMGQLLHHILDNALKFRLPDRPPIIRVSAETNSQNQVVLTVSDNGIGFEEQYMDKVFQPFQRLHSREDYPGSGIGLAICRRVVERHGGSITATSDPGKGSTFTLCLPIKQKNLEV
jgi:PAS domain S-box-containing protein